MEKESKSRVTYLVKSDTIKAFNAVCDNNLQTRSKVIEKMMESYIVDLKVVGAMETFFNVIGEGEDK